MWIDYRQASRPHNNLRPPDIPKGPDSEKDFANQQAFMNWPEEAAVATDNEAAAAIVVTASAATVALGMMIAAWTRTEAAVTETSWTSSAVTPAKFAARLVLKASLSKEAGQSTAKMYEMGMNFKQRSVQIVHNRKSHLNQQPEAKSTKANRKKRQ